MSTSTSTGTATPARRHGARLVSALTTLLLVVATLAGLAYLAPGLLGYERYVITGGSMSGTIEKGAVAFEKRVPVADLEVGDIITYLPPADSGVTTLVTHRIVEAAPSEQGGTLFRTQGDANPDPDPWTFSLVSGTQPVVEHSVPKLGWLFIALADRDIRMMVVGIPAAIIALISLLELGKALRPTRSSHRSESDELDVPEPPALPTPSATLPVAHPLGSRAGALPLPLPVAVRSTSASR